jgi:hypothetical protein
MIMQIFGPKIDASIRHTVGLAGPWLIAHQVAPELVESFLSSTAGVLSVLVSGVISLGWSILEKRARDKLPSVLKF